MVAAAILKGERPAKPEGAACLGFSTELWMIVERCWRENRAERPKIEDILTCLSDATAFWYTRPLHLEVGKADPSKPATNATTESPMSVAFSTPSRIIKETEQAPPKYAINATMGHKRILVGKATHPRTTEGIASGILKRAINATVGHRPTSTPNRSSQKISSPSLSSRPPTVSKKQKGSGPKTSKGDMDRILQWKWVSIRALLQPHRLMSPIPSLSFTRSSKRRRKRSLTSVSPCITFSSTQLTGTHDTDDSAINRQWGFPRP